MSDDLYREICRDPEDDTLRLAYADWLDENGDPDRAEFVRLDVERHHRWPDFAAVCDADRPTTYPDWERLSVIEKRLLTLGTAHTKWSRLPCETCEGTGVIDQGCYCPTCSGMGDLFLARTECYPGRTTLVPIYYAVTFARGFPDSVSCTLAEAFASDGTPTPWACEVVRRTPVTRFVLGGGAEPNWAELPGWLIDAMPAGAMSRHPRHYETVGHAADALALAAGRLIRKHVYGGATQ